MNNTAPNFNPFPNIPQTPPTTNNQFNQGGQPTFNQPASNVTPMPNNQFNFNNNQEQNSNNDSQNGDYEKEETKLYHKRSKIVKFATNTTFFEVLNYNFKRGKVVINMQSYKNNKHSIKISLSFGEFLYLKNLVTSGLIFQRQQDNYGNLFKFQKGTGAKYNNGSVIARQFSVQLSKNPDRYPLVFFAQEGPGRQNDKGLIQFSGAPTKSVNFPMTHEMLIEFFDLVTLHLEGYMAACYQYQLTSNPFFTKE